VTVGGGNGCPGTKERKIVNTKKQLKKDSNPYRQGEAKHVLAKVKEIHDEVGKD